jgi:hypothetical protein
LHSGPTLKTGEDEAVAKLFADTAAATEAATEAADSEAVTEAVTRIDSSLTRSRVMYCIVIIFFKYAIKSFK